MKRICSFSALFILLIASLLTFTACDANTLTGTDDSDPEQQVQMYYDTTDDPPHTDPNTGHNTGCPEGDPECE